MGLGLHILIKRQTGSSFFLLHMDYKVGGAKL
jgi:hypothetical protein